MKRIIASSPLIAALALSAPAAAQTPEHIPLQGYLESADGTPVDEGVNFTVALYDTRVGGTPLYTESQFLMVDDGRFVVPVGKETPFPWFELNQDRPLYVGLTINDDAELTPRFELGTVPYASRAFSAHTLRGAAPEDFATTGHTHDWGDVRGVPADLGDGDDDTLAALSCAPNQVPKASTSGWMCAADQGLSSVGAGDIAAGAVDTSALADDAVATPKLANGAVTNTKLADRAVTNTKLLDGAVSSSKIQNFDVAESDLASGAVTSRVIRTDAVTSSRIRDDAVRANHIAANQVGTSELANGSVTRDQLALSVSEHCVLGAGPFTTVSGRAFCGLSEVPSNVRCEIFRLADGSFRLYEVPSGPSNCCMQCF